MKFYTLIFIIATHIIHAQNFKWAKDFGGVNEQRSWAIVADNKGNSFTTGYYNGVSDFDPGSGTYTLASNSSQDYDCFVSKLDVNGNFIWAKKFGGLSYTIGYSIALDSIGNIYISGIFAGTVDFDPGPGLNNLVSVANTDGFIVKLDVNGNFVWAKQVTGSSNGEVVINSIMIDKNNNILTTGYFAGATDFDPGSGNYVLSPINSGPYNYMDVFILKIDATGNFAWAKNFGGGDHDYGYAIAYDNTGNIYTTGIFQGIVDFDPGPGTYNLNMLAGGDYISKLDPNGIFLWAKNLSNISSNSSALFDGKPKDIQLDALGNIYTTGNFKGTADFDPGPGTYTLMSNGNADVFISKLDNAGNFIWAKSFGGTADERHTSLALDGLGNIFTTGKIQLTIDFDPGPGVYSLTSTSSLDIYVSQLDVNGNFVWATKTGGPGNNLGNCITSDHSGSIYVSGYFTNTCNFDTLSSANLVATGSFDAFVAKYSAKDVGLNELSIRNNFFIYPNPVNDELNIKFQDDELKPKDFKLEIANALGQVVLLSTASKQSYSINIKGLPAGVYQLKINSGSKQGTYKFIKN
ncbi:MAG: SBBP repeat-containing protein [Bacteroidetes bacterium]|nr:SBBP repeat-containing protein [Bacteroidota bacterium]